MFGGGERGCTFQRVMGVLSSRRLTGTEIHLLDKEGGEGVIKGKRETDAHSSEGKK